MKRFKAILCVVGSEGGQVAALERAVSLAENNQAGLTVVTVAPGRRLFGKGEPDAPDPDQLHDAVVDAHATMLESMVKPHRQRLEITTRVLQGTPFLQITREVLRRGHDLVLKDPEAQDFLAGLVGSDDMHLLRKCPCPVWLVKRDENEAYRRVLAAVDVDDCYPEQELRTRHHLNCEIMELAMSIALADFAELHIVHAWSAIGEDVMRGGFLHRPEAEVDAYVNGVRAKQARAVEVLIDEIGQGQSQDALEYLKPQKHLVKGRARKEIPLLAKDIEADLIIMGTVARTGISGFIMGNTAEAILSQIDCSVLAVKPRGFETPIALDD